MRNRILARVGAWFERELGSPHVASWAAPIAEARRSGGGVSAQELRDLATVRGYFAGQGIMPLFDAPWAPVFLAIVFVIHPVLGWIGLGVCACAALNDLATRKRLTEANSASVRALNDADAAIRNADAITAMGMLPDWRAAGRTPPRAASTSRPRPPTPRAASRPRPRRCASACRRPCWASGATWS